jgi:hypothetical protein
MTRLRTTHIPGQAALIARAACASTPEQIAVARGRVDWENIAEPKILDYADEAPGPWTSFDAKRAKEIPEPAHCNWWGLLFARLHRELRVEPVGWDQSHRPSSGRSGVRQWQRVGGDPS